MSAFKNLDDFLILFNKVKPIGNGEHQALCPAHNDRSPSLHIKQSGNKILVNCKAGCQTPDILKAVNLAMPDLFIDGETKQPRTIKETYDYKDEHGNLLFQVVRYEPKSFSQRRPNGQGQWINNLQGITPVLYHLPDVLIAKSGDIYITEGEKDADALWNWGLIATCNPMGAGKWKPQYTTELEGANRVIIVPDKDDAGRQHARYILQALAGKVKAIKVVEVPGENNKDVSDWLANGGHIDDLLALVESIPEHKPIIRITEEGGNSLLKRKFAPIKWIVPDMLPEGMALIAGTPKTGKSRMAFNIALAVATGGKALSKMDVKQGSVLYVSLEDSDRRLKEHLLEIFGDEPPDLAKITFKYVCRLINEGGLEDIETWLKAHTDARLIVIDTLKRIRPKDTGGTLYTQDYDSVSPFTDLAARYNVAILVIHHLNKRPSSDDPMELISGTTGLTGAVDTTIVVRRKRGEVEGTMHIYGRDIEDTEIALDFTAGQWTWIGEAKQYRMGQERKEILDLLREQPDLTPSEIAKSLDKNRNTTGNLLAKMRKDNQVSLCDGVYNAVI